MTIEELEYITARANESATDRQEWESLRTLSEGRMRDDRQDDETRLRWARLALTACQRQGRAGDLESTKALANQAYIRVHVIREFGPVQGDPIRDTHDLCDKVFREIGASRDQIADEAAEWRSAPPNRMLRLRYAKNLLTPLKPLMDSIPQSDPIRQDLAEWLSLIPNLP
ncbi:hypothetical protein [Streptomyces bungoensis]|uniref:hypothetical protein n=1 Tax=Streptomyces bungoensis TaxID=285568 RepID=UPI0033F5F337